MIHRILCFAMAVCLVCSLGVSAAGAEVDGSFLLHLNVDDLAVTNGAFTLYRVGVRISDGYRIGEDFGGGFVREEDALSPHLAQWLAEGQGQPLQHRLLDADGDCSFSQLGEGLYLLVQSESTDGFYPIQPFLMTMPRDGRWQLPIYLEPLPRIAESPATGEGPLLALGLLGMALSGTGLVLCCRRKTTS